MTTLRVRATHPPSQGEYVIIDAEHYDPAVHVLYEDAPGLAPAAPDASNAPVSSAPAPDAPTRKRKG